MILNLAVEFRMLVVNILSGSSSQFTGKDGARNLSPAEITPENSLLEISIPNINVVSHF